ncbi:MAG: hypothetical protein NVSMB31_18710 [Vulcanimicrobiaceae bacterium]
MLPLMLATVVLTIAGLLAAVPLAREQRALAVVRVRAASPVREPASGTTSRAIARPAVPHRLTLPRWLHRRHLA